MYSVLKYVLPKFILHIAIVLKNQGEVLNVINPKKYTQKRDYMPILWIG